MARWRCTARYGAEFEYRLTGLQPGGQYILRLHWAELDFHAPGDRVFQVLVGGQAVPDRVDVIAEAGVWRRVLIKELPVIADPEGRVVVGFARSGPDNPFISGPELLLS